MIRGLTSTIMERVDVSFYQDIEHPFTGCSHFHLDSLLNMGMIYLTGESYGLMEHGGLVFTSRAGEQK